MHIVIACGAMSFGPRTPSVRSLGGSETAALELAKALGRRGHQVQMFCNLPQSPAPDACAHGFAEDGVTYYHIEALGDYVTAFDHDLFIGVRDPQFMMMPSRSKKKVLWAHDIFTKRGMRAALDKMQWTFDEIWSVSEWHRQQIHEATGYPLKNIVALRNGIVKHTDLIDLGHDERTLIYAARPERGLENLIMPGGIMDNLPEFKLIVAMYEHFPEHMRDYYMRIFQRMKEMPNVEYIGGKSNHDLRQLIGQSAAYIYPTQFEETSCILARECCEQRTPFITTKVGALTETLGNSGIFFEDWLQANGIAEPERGTQGWCKVFAMFFREVMKRKDILDHIRGRMSERTDLYWDGVAVIVEAHAKPPEPKDFSRIWSLIQDGDVMAAMAFTKTIVSPDFPTLKLIEQFGYYRDLGAEYYDSSYEIKRGTPEDELVFKRSLSSPRHEAIEAVIAKLPPGSTVFEYGCGAGHIIAPMAVKYPHVSFMGYDVSDAAVRVVINGDVPNLTATTDIDVAGSYAENGFDVVICSEVLEHVKEPWITAAEVESFARPGGKVVITVPFGPWEVYGFQRPGHWHERFHVWNIDVIMLREMFGTKPDMHISKIASSATPLGEMLGNHVVTYTADHDTPIPAVDPLAKAMRADPQQTCAAAVIAFNNQDTIMRMLDSIEHSVQYIQIAHGPSTDQTRAIIDDWAERHPWVIVSVIDVQKIEARKFGFDDARKVSVAGLDAVFDWTLWIDTDEYLANNFRKYLRNSSLQAYLVPQHHFTVEPRGSAPQIDRPARLFRNGEGFRVVGHIHEHFEVPEGGPGRAWELPDVDIGHTGYVNESVRKDRFHRNFPFLEWEHEEPKQRKLNHFLWLRDIIHRMRFEAQHGNVPKAVMLAQEAEKYYNDHYEDMAAFGPGIFMALQYLAEAYQVLGKGVPMKIAIQMEDRATTFQGSFAEFGQIERVLRQLLEPEFKDRASRYY